jgi:hypothetical protein
MPRSSPCPPKKVEYERSAAPFPSGFRRVMKRSLPPDFDG